MEDFDKLLGKVYDLGLKIMMDFVVNYIFDENKWFEELCKSKINLYCDYYIWCDGNVGKLFNNWGLFFRGFVWKYDE